MKMNRRRFLTISAATAAAPVWAESHSWQGRALGTEVSLTIRGPRAEVARALADARVMLKRVEAMFSLYDPASDLSQLNSIGALLNPDPDFLNLLHIVNQGHHMTDGLFDPTVQPLWQAYATGGDIIAAQAAVGWDRVQFDAEHVRLETGQALTLNGIAQGFATDLIADHLAAIGLTDVLVNIGEHRGIGGPWRLGISDPTHGHLGMRTLTTGAVATSSPAALLFGDVAHILHPNHPAQWSTVSVEADTAAIADCLSTALCLAPRDMAVAVAEADNIQRITLIDFAGDLVTI